MRLQNQEIHTSATDLAKHVACRHLTGLDISAAKGVIKRIYRNDPAIAVLEERGRRHEIAYLSHLKEHGYDVMFDEAEFDDEKRVRRTIDAMKAGIGVIVQGGLNDGRWFGRADVLLRVDRPSDLGN